MNIFSFLNDVGDYEYRKVGNDQVGGLIVSTAYTSDEGYETAIGDLRSFYPVERYANKSAAAAGHERWVEFAKTRPESVMRLSGLGGLVPPEKFMLQYPVTAQSKEPK